MRPVRIPLVLLLVLAGAVLAAAPALAADPAGGERNLVEENLTLKHVVTSIAIFLILLFVLTKTAWRPILEGLRRREAVIRQAVDDAQRASEEARALIARYEEKIGQAREESRAIAEEARKDAEAVRRRILDEAERQSQDRLAQVLKEIEQAKAVALEELLQQAAVVATEVAGRIVRRELSPEANADLVDEVVREYAASKAGPRA